MNWIIGTECNLQELLCAKQQQALDYVAGLRYSEDEYFYVSDYNSVLIGHPSLQGRDMSEVRDPNGVLIVPPMVEIARRDGEGFHRYSWRKLKDEQLYEKLTFSRHLEAWQWVIGTGVYLDMIDHDIKLKKNELERNLRIQLRNKKIGETGYIYIFSSTAKMIIHPNVNIEGEDFGHVKHFV